MNTRWLCRLNEERTGDHVPQFVRVDEEPYMFGTDGRGFAMVRGLHGGAVPSPVERQAVALLSGKPSGVVRWEDFCDWMADMPDGRARDPAPARMVFPGGRVTEALDRRRLARVFGGIRVSSRIHVVARPPMSVRPFLFYPDDRAWIVGLMGYREVPPKSAPVLRLRLASKLRKRAA